jgi:hypothetical protein
MGAKLELRDQVVLSITTRRSESVDPVVGGDTEAEAPVIPRIDA